MMIGRPCTLLGIVSDGRAEDARKLIEKERMNWPNLLVGGDKVAEQYHVRSNPSYFVIDAEGVIRAKGNRRLEEIEKLVGQLVREAETRKLGEAKTLK